MHTRSLSFIVAASTLMGCGGQKISWSTEEVDAQLELIAANVPACSVVERGSAPAARIAPGLLRADGSCGGTIFGTSEHENGVTDFEVVAEDFCVNTEDGPVVLDGTILAKEIGTPSDDGPIIEALELETDGPFTATQENGDVATLELEGGRVEYGKPAAWAPEAPDAANPDELRAQRATVTQPDGTVGYVENVEVTRVGDLEAELTITDGRIGREGGEWAELRTPDGDPLVFDILGLGFTGGSGELVGKGDSTVTVTPDPDNPGVFEIELDGAPHPNSLDCSPGLAPALEVGFAVFLELPLY